MSDDLASAVERVRDLAKWLRDEYAEHKQPGDLKNAEAIDLILSALKDAGEDSRRLDFLDECNARLNGQYGTQYGWKLILNHNVNRLMLGHMEVDLHDSHGGNDKLPSCRLAIDESVEALRLVLEKLRA